jgi:hypothetical protein
LRVLEWRVKEERKRENGDGYFWLLGGEVQASKKGEARLCGAPFFLCWVGRSELAVTTGPLDDWQAQETERGAGNGKGGKSENSRKEGKERL